MNAEPAFVDRTSPSLKFRRNCTAGEASEPKVAVAITHLGGVQGPVVVTTEVAVREVVVSGVVTVAVVVTDPVVNIVDDVTVVVGVVMGPTVNTAVAESPAPALV
jgi:hypothetical protein